jgi:hypothetical protein
MLGHTEFLMAARRKISAGREKQQRPLITRSCVLIIAGLLVVWWCALIHTSLGATASSSSRSKLKLEEQYTVRVRSPSETRTTRDRLPFAPSSPPSPPPCRPPATPHTLHGALEAALEPNAMVAAHWPRSPRCTHAVPFCHCSCAARRRRGGERQSASSVVPHAP